MSLQGLYRTLLATLIQHEECLFRVAFPDWQISQFDYQSTSAVLRDALENILVKSEISCKYCFFLDGLDEYKETDPRLKAELSDDILRLARLPAVKLVVSSRPESIFKLKFAHFPTMELHDLTRRDIAAYVDAEVRWQALPQVLTAIDTCQLDSLCNEVICKSQGVFLWVNIAVASILNGIADFDTIPELRSKLGTLDPRLSVLFKQVLTERVQDSHRKQMSRSLLTHTQLGKTFQYLPLQYYSIFQALSPRVDASHDHSLLLDNNCEIDAHILDLHRRLPGRSCGLFWDSWDETNMELDRFVSITCLFLSHMSLRYFLDEHVTQDLLLEQAGGDFQVDEAIAVGHMAALVYGMERDPYAGGSAALDRLLMIVHSIEETEVSTGLAQTRLMSIFDELLARDFTKCSSPLATPFKTDWDPLYEISCNLKISTSNPGRRLLQPQGLPCHGSDLLSLTLAFGYTCFLKHKMTISCGVPPKTGTPLLFYPLWNAANFGDWVYQTERRKSDHITGTEGCYAAPVKMLLVAGADPNERCHGVTPWSTVLHRLHIGRDDNFFVYPSDAVRGPNEFLLETLEMAKLMLQHGADSFLCMETQDYNISPQIFAELLGEECCSGSGSSDCSCDYGHVCAYSGEVPTRLKELVELVEERRHQKQQVRTDGELLVQGAWLAMVFAYILHSLLTWVS
jgi:hypothetical protein